jgi:hypothetical protein
MAATATADEMAVDGVYAHRMISTFDFDGSAVVCYNPTT